MPTPTFPLLALTLSSLAILAMRRHALAWGLADLPGGRKEHQGVIPLIGGLGVFIGFLLVQPLLGIAMAGWLPFYVGLVGLLVCGVVDDARVIRSTDKLGIQLTVAALMVVSGGQSLDYLGTFPLLGEIHLGWWLAMPFTILAVTGLINAINMMDGVDGLAGSSALSMLAWLAFVAALQGQLELLAMIVTLGASLVGFLLFNLRHPWRRSASVFMGDAGSMALGFAIAWFVVALSQSDTALVSPVAYAWLLALPVMDTLSLMVRRMRQGRSPFAPDRDHLHHLFLRARFTPGQTTMILMLMVGASGGVGVMLSLAGVPDGLLLVGWLCLLVLHDLFVRCAWRTSKALRRIHLATLGAAASHQRQRWSVRLHQRPMVGGKRRLVAVLGAYLLCFNITLNVTLALAGGGMMLVAALASPAVLWRDLHRLPLFWVSLLLSAYVVLRLMAGGGPGRAVDWSWLWLAGLVSLPLGWWLAQLRVHWTGLVVSLLGGGAMALVLQADWSRLPQQMLTSPGAWGEPGRVGFMTGMGVMVVLASLFAGLQRLGIGWRPTYQVALSLLCALAGGVVLVSTGFVTAWLATLAGVLCFAVASALLGGHPRHRSGRRGFLLMLVAGAAAVVSLQLLAGNGADLAMLFIEPLQALGLALRGEMAQAHVLHPGMAERLLLWQQAWQAWQGHWLFGHGAGAITADAWPSGYRDDFSLVAAVATGLGLVGVVGFATVVLISLHALIGVALKRLWPASWALGTLSCGVMVLVMSLLAMPVYYPQVLVFLMFFSAFTQAAVIHNAWLRQPRQSPPLSPTRLQRRPLPLA